jgi:hypothetical protein
MTWISSLREQQRANMTAWAFLLVMMALQKCKPLRKREKLKLKESEYRKDQKSRSLQKSDLEDH